MSSCAQAHRADRPGAAKQALPVGYEQVAAWIDRARELSYDMLRLAGEAALLPRLSGSLCDFREVLLSTITYGIEGAEHRHLREIMRRLAWPLIVSHRNELGRQLPSLSAPHHTAQIHGSHIAKESVDESTLQRMAVDRGALPDASPRDGERRPWWTNYM